MFECEGSLQNKDSLAPSLRLWKRPVQSLGSFTNDYGDSNENVQKAIGLITKKTTPHVHYTSWYISLPSLHGYDLKFPDGTFYEPRKQTTTNFSFRSF